MSDQPNRALEILEDEKASRQHRVRAAHTLAVWARVHQSEAPGVEGVFEKLTGFWQELCDPAEGSSRGILFDRIRTASACTTMSLALPQGQVFFRNIPRSWRAEGPDPRKEGTLIHGEFSYTYGSLYEFHLEYPIEGFGIRKDLISVVEKAGVRIPLFVWLKTNQLVVWCSRCGLDITFEISRDCPARRTGHLKR
jgi:hypothetical protein